MPSGYPNSGRYAGRGLQHKSVTCPRCGKTYNAHYFRYSGHVCIDGRTVRGDTVVTQADVDYINANRRREEQPRVVRPPDNLTIQRGSIFVARDRDTGATTRYLLGEAWVLPGESGEPVARITPNSPVGRQLLGRGLRARARRPNGAEIEIVEIAGAGPPNVWKEPWLRRRLPDEVQRDVAAALSAEVQRMLESVHRASDELRALCLSTPRSFLGIQLVQIDNEVITALTDRVRNDLHEAIARAKESATNTQLDGRRNSSLAGEAEARVAAELHRQTTSLLDLMDRIRDELSRAAEPRRLLGIRFHDRHAADRLEAAVKSFEPHLSRAIRAL